MRRIILGIFAALLLCVPAFAYPPISVFVDGEALSFDQPPIIQDDRTLVPMRGIFQALGAEVTWDEPSQTVMAVNGNDVMLFRIGDAGLYKNGQLVYTMSVPAQIVNDRTLVPIRAIAESFGAQVDWDGVNYIITITSAGGTVSAGQGYTQIGQTAPAEGGFSAQVIAADGTVILTAKLSCDVLKNGKSTDSINTAMANETFAQGQGFLLEYAQQALEAYQKQGNSFMPYYYVGTYHAEREGGDYASFLASVVEYAGAEENVRYFSRTYDRNTGKEVALEDLVTDSRESLEILWRVSFGALIEADPDAFYSNALERLVKNMDQVDFYLTEDGIAFYLSPEVIAPVDTGAVSFEIQYDF